MVVAVGIVADEAAAVEAVVAQLPLVAADTSLPAHGSVIVVRIACVALESNFAAAADAVGLAPPRAPEPVASLAAGDESVPAAAAIQAWGLDGAAAAVPVRSASCSESSSEPSFYPPTAPMAIPVENLAFTEKDRNATLSLVWAKIQNRWVNKPESSTSQSLMHQFRGAKKKERS